MTSSRFGEHTIFYRNDDPKQHADSLPRLVSERGFSKFSPEGVTSYLTFRYPIGDLTLFDGYRRVPAGCRVTDGSIEPYWYPDFKEQKVPFDVALNRVEELLVESIKNLTDGKKVAVPLSGGVDSTLILALYRKVFPAEPVYTYSAGFYGDDEFEYSRLAAKEFGSIHKEKILRKDDYIGAECLLRPLIEHKGEPLHPNEIALAEVERLAKEDGCDIAVCGEGSDDIFGGYGQNLRMYLNYAEDRPFFDYFLDNYRYFSLEDRPGLIKDEYLVDDLQLLEKYMVKSEMPPDPRNQVFYFTQKIHTPGLIIRGVNAMRFSSLEEGFPYLYDPLVDFVNSLPFDYKLHWKSDDHQRKAAGRSFREISEELDVPKYILKKLAEQYLPHKIIYRPKYGFPVPFEKWLGQLDEWPLDPQVFRTTDLRGLSGWKKFMTINLNACIEIFRTHQENQ
ncbi:MAG: asparagine synthase [Candidatus Zixiibacteriota bacterium]|nr:MAG: asparagine synthase [candidate division Zixibacteria bacterium]